MTDETDQPFLPGLEPERKRHRATELPNHRAFLALKPDDPAAERASEITLRLKREYRLAGKPLKRENYHISLPMIYEGDEFPADLPEIASARFQAIRMPPFEITLDKVMSFGRSERHVLVLGTTRSLANIYGLYRRIVMESGLKVREGSFNPHMTILRTDGFVREQAIEPIRWEAREFVLVHSFPRLGRHETVARWPLR